MKKIMFVLLLGVLAGCATGQRKAAENHEPRLMCKEVSRYAGTAAGYREAGLSQKDAEKKLEGYAFGPLPADLIQQLKAGTSDLINIVYNDPASRKLSPTETERSMLLQCLHRIS